MPAEDSEIEYPQCAVLARLAEEEAIRRLSQSLQAGESATERRSSILGFSERIDRCALGIELLEAWVRQTGSDFPEGLKDPIDLKPKLDHGPPASSRIPEWRRHLARLAMRNFGLLSDRDHPAADIVALASMMDPSPIPVSYFSNPSLQWTESIHKARQGGEPEKVAHEWISTAAEFGLLEWMEGEDSFAVHPFIQWAVTRWIDPEILRMYATSLTLFLPYAIPGRDLYMPWDGTWPPKINKPVEQGLRHVSAAEEYLKDAKIRTPEFFEYAESFVMSGAGFLGNNIRPRRTLLRMAQEIDDPGGPLTREATRRLADDLTHELKFQKSGEAESLLLSLLANEEATYGVDSLELAPTLLELADLYNWTQDYDKMERLLRRRAALFASAYGRDSLEALAEEYLIYNYRVTNSKDPREEDFLKRMVMAHRETSGPHTVKFLSAVIELNSYYLKHDRRSEAKLQAREALSIVEQLEEEKQQAIPELLEIKARLLGQMDRHDESAQAYLDVVNAKKQRQDMYAPLWLFDLWSVADQYQLAKQYDKAEYYFRQHFAIQDPLWESQLCGDLKYGIPMNLTALVYVILEQGRIGDAETIARKAMDHLLAEGHPGKTSDHARSYEFNIEIWENVLEDIAEARSKAS